MVEVRLLSTMGVAGVMKAKGPGFERAEGVTLASEFLPTQQLMARIRGGERADLAILTDQGVDELVAAGVLEGRTDLARSYVGIAVRAGAPHPDISTKEAFIATMLAAQSVAMSQAGASGMFFAALIERLGIAEQVRPKATIVNGFTAPLAASGEVEIAVQQVSELMTVPGVEIVGRLPAEIESVTLFSAGVFRGAAQAATGRKLIQDLASAETAALFRSCGLDPAGTGHALQA